MTVYDAFPRGETLVIAHRGARARAPENTLKAFSLAADESAHGIELDVRLARSGEVVVLHDADLARVTEGADPRLCVDLSLDELRRIDVGEGERVPTLLDVLALARERGLFVNVEMKRDVPSRRAVVEAVAPLVRSSVGSAPVVVSSFDPIMLGWLGILVPEVTRALLVHASSYHDLMAFAPPFIGAHGGSCRARAPRRAPHGLLETPRLRLRVDGWLGQRGAEAGATRRARHHHRRPPLRAAGSRRRGVTERVERQSRVRPLGARRRVGSVAVDVGLVGPAGLVQRPEMLPERWVPVAVLPVEGHLVLGVGHAHLDRMR